MGQSVVHVHGRVRRSMPPSVRLALGGNTPGGPGAQLVEPGCRGGYSVAVPAEDGSACRVQVRAAIRPAASPARIFAALLYAAIDKLAET
jgi:hypothetical protein